MRIPTNRDDINVSSAEMRGSRLTVRHGFRYNGEESVGVDYPLATPHAIAGAVRANGSLVYDVDPSQKDALIRDMASWAIGTYEITEVVSLFCPSRFFSKKPFDKLLSDVDKKCVPSRKKLFIIDGMHNLIGEKDSSPNTFQSYAVECLERFLGRRGNEKIPFVAMTTHKNTDYEDEPRAQLVEKLEPVEFTADINPGLRKSYKRDQASPLSRKTRQAIGLPT